MKVIWLRHALREVNLSEDPALSEEGKQQSRRLVAAAQSGIFPAPTVIHSSPKLRCVQTVTPLAEAGNLPLEINPVLDEQRSAERTADFRRRIQTFLDFLETSDKEQCHLLCTHSDWLQEAVSLIPHEDPRIDHLHSFACAAPLVFQVDEGFWSLSLP